MYQVTSAAKELEAPATTEVELFERLCVYANSVIRVQHTHSQYWMNVITTGTLSSAQIRSSHDGYDEPDSLHVRIGNEDWVRLNVMSKVSVLLDGSWKVIHENLPKDDDEEELETDDDVSIEDPNYAYELYERIKNDDYSDL